MKDKIAKIKDIEVRRESKLRDYFESMSQSEFYDKYLKPSDIDNYCYTRALCLFYYSIITDVDKAVDSYHTSVEIMSYLSFLYPNGNPEDFNTKIDQSKFNQELKDIAAFIPEKNMKDLLAQLRTDKDKVEEGVKQELEHERQRKATTEGLMWFGPIGFFLTPRIQKKWNRMWLESNSLSTTMKAISSFRFDIIVYRDAETPFKSSVFSPKELESRFNSKVFNFIKIECQWAIYRRLSTWIDSKQSKNSIHLTSSLINRSLMISEFLFETALVNNVWSVTAELICYEEEWFNDVMIILSPIYVISLSYNLD